MSTGTSGSTARVTGLASGFDTQSIVNSLMSLERAPYQKLEVKKETEDVKLQAYQAVNTYLLKLRTSMNSLASRTLWNSNAAVSTNDKSLTANASEYAVKGTYNFRVAQRATQAQYMTKGFSRKDSPLVKQTNVDPAATPEPLGGISVASAKTRVDNSAKLDDMNGGKGVYRGSVRVTDSSGNSSVIDLSACDTLEDVTRTLNASSGAQVMSYIDEEGRLCVKDASNGSGSVRIQNVGAGTTASDLGIAGTSSSPAAGANAVLVGGNAYTLGNDMSLSLLNDGLGVEPGDVQFTVADATGNARKFFVNINDCETVGDLVKRVNAAIDAERNRDDSGEALKKEALEDLRFTISDDKTSFALIGTKANTTYTIGKRDGTENLQGKGNPSDDLGLTGRYVNTGTANDITFDRILGSANSPMLKSLTGATGKGVGTSSSPDNPNGKMRVPFNENTLLKNLNGGAGIDLSNQFAVQTWEGGLASTGGKAVLHNNIFTNSEVEDFMNSGGVDKTVGDLIDFMNQKIADYAANPDNNAAGLKGMEFAFDADAGVMTLEGAQAGYGYEILGSVPYSLGIQAAKQINNGIGIDGDTYTDEKPIQDALDAFYGVTGPTRLTDDNKTLGGESVMGDLLGLAGLDKASYIAQAGALGDYADIGTLTAEEQFEAAKAAKQAEWEADSRTAINGMFASGGTFDISYDRGDGTMNAVSVNWSDVATALGGAIDENTKVNDFIDAVNSTIETAFTAAGAVDVNGDPIVAPKMAVNNYNNGLKWSNVDMSRQWSMSGDMMDEMLLAKDTSAIFAANNNQMTMQQPTGFPPPVNPPMVSGYPALEDLETTTTLDSLNFGTGLNIQPDKTITIDLGDNGSITLDTNDIRAGLAAVTNDPPTVDDYLGVLNNLVDTELGTLNANLGYTGTDAVSFEFGIVDDNIALTNFQNVDKVTVAGDGLTGVTSQGVPVYDMGFGPVAETEIEAGDNLLLGQPFPASLVEGTVEGVGQIALSIGSNGAVIRLGTDGLDQNSTLNELVAKLNSELDEIAKDPAAAATYGYTQDDIDALKDLRFTLNENGTGLAVDNGMKKAVAFHDTVDANGVSDNQTLGQELGLVGKDNSDVRVESQTFDNMGSLNRRIVSRATKLDEYLGANQTLGAIRLTDAAGKSQVIGLENCETIGDVLDAINGFTGSGLGMMAQINEKGDGIEILQGWASGMTPPASDITGVIQIEDLENGTTAKKLGIAGRGETDKDTGRTAIDGSTSINIEVMPDDTLESLMYRIAESGEYTCSIVNSGTATNPSYRLSVASATTGEASDFVISSDVDALGFTQTSRGRDAKVLYGDPSSNASPILLSSSTNSNSSAILGLTLDIKQESSEWTSITVDTDKEKVTDEIKNMVTAYNDLVSLIMQLDGYDTETGEKGILFGDPNVRGMMDTINEFFYQVYNPGNLKYGEKTEDGEQGIWSWMDAGIQLSSRNSNSDGSGSWFTTLEFDEDALKTMVSEHWDVLSAMMASEQNIADPSRPASARPTASFNGGLEGPAGNAVNGNITKSGSNGITATDTIANGSDTYTIMFQQPVTISRMSIYHESAENSLRDFVVEYMDPSSGEWMPLRNLPDNTSAQTHIGGGPTPPTASGVRIRALETNAPDGKFRLLDVQIFEQSGLASKLNNAVNSLGDATDGFLATRTEEHTSSIADIQEQMDRLQDILDGKEEALWRKFTAMETALGKLQNQKDYINKMLGGAK